MFTQGKKEHIPRLSNPQNMSLQQTLCVLLFFSPLFNNKNLSQNFPYVEHLPTFGTDLWYMEEQIPYMEHLGKVKVIHLRIM